MLSAAIYLLTHSLLLSLHLAGNPGSFPKPLSAEEEAWYQQEIEGIYDTFVGVVSDGRSMSKEAVDSIAQGRVWAGRDALKIGLCDEKGTLLDAIAYTAKLAGLGKYRIEVYPERKSFLEGLKSGDKADRKDPLVQFHYLKEPGFKALARMPYITIDPVK